MANPLKGKPKAAGDGKAFPVPTAGTHEAVLVGMIDLGSHPDDFDKDRKSDYLARKYWLVWEMLDEGLTLAKEYTITFNEKGSLRKLAEALRGRKYQGDDDIDYTKLLGQPALVTVEHGQSGDRVYGKITNIGPMTPKQRQQVGKPKHQLVHWYIGSDEPFPDGDWVPYYFGRPLIERMQDSDEYRKGGGKEEPAAEASEEGEVGAAAAVAGTSNQNEPPF